MSYPLPTPSISDGLPSYTNDDYSGSFPASWGNDTSFGGSHAWRCATQPTGGANDGNLTQTVWWVVDLSTVPAVQRQSVIFYWQNSAVTGAYAPDSIGQNPNNLLKSFTIQINTAAGGGSAPTSGWSTVATITGNTLHSCQRLVNMAGANWIGVFITAIHGSSGNNNAQGKFRVFDAHLGVQDSWFMAGDSITQRAFMDDESNGFGQTIPHQIHSLYPAFYPLWEAGGEGGWTSADYLPNFATWLANFPGRYVALCFGTNDANNGGVYLSTFSSNMTSMVQQTLAAGKIPVIPTIPWGGTTNLINNVPTLNTQIAAIIAANPGCITGPDLYLYFSTHQSEIDPSDHIHPTDPALATGNGYPDYKTLWVNWAIANIYRNVLNTQAQSKFKVRTVLNSPAQSKFKVRTKLSTTAESRFTVQLVNTGPKPYAISQVVTKLIARPFSTINSQATVVDQNGVHQNTLNCTVTVTFPDNSMATPTVYFVGNGAYSTAYNTKGAGTLKELWTFTDNQGGQIEFQNQVVCSF